MEINYKVTSGQEQVLIICMSINVSSTCPVSNITFYIGGKDLQLLSCRISGEKTRILFTSPDTIALPVISNETTELTYHIQLAKPGKHGHHGFIDNEFIVFEGGQVFLLPVDFYTLSDIEMPEAVENMTFTFDFASLLKKQAYTNPVEIIPFNELIKPGQAEIYSLCKNAFVFGDFVKIKSKNTPAADSFSVNVLNREKEKYINEPGFFELYSYYNDLFNSHPDSYNTVLLPLCEDSGLPIIGGSGEAVCASSFDIGKLRDWQLLSHRMFHAFFISTAYNPAFFIPPNLWINEGLASYYEIVSLESLNDTLKSYIGADGKSQLAGMFSQYLYIRFRYPGDYDFAPMQEAEVIYSGAKKEFLHYTMAPLLITAFEETAVKNGAKPDSLLHYCLNNRDFPTDGNLAKEAAFSILGKDAEFFYESYFSNPGIPVLWKLSVYLPGNNELIAMLNYIDYVLESWIHHK